MAANMALKRARKAQRRKQIVTEKRKVELLETGLAGQVRRAVEMPIQHCLVTEELFECGMGTLVLARGATPHHMIVASFLLDVFCLGVKDVIVRSAEAEEFAIYVAGMGAAAPLSAVDPSYARKLLRDAAAWAQSIGFAPHRDFAVADQVFGDVDAAACNVEFRFGRNGEPVYVPGPSESPWLIRRRQEQMRRRLGS
jgi:hypothetical protein